MDYLVSIIVPCYNSEKYIHRLLDSILNQTYKNIELILINDGSTDKTESIINDYSKLFKESNIILKYKYQKNAGQAAAVNVGLKMVEGDYFCWADSDDFYLPSYTEKNIDFFKTHNEVNILRTDRYAIPEKHIDEWQGKEWPRSSDWNWNLHCDSYFMNCLLEKNFHFGSDCTMFNTKAFDKVVKNREICQSKSGQNWQLLLPMLYYYKSEYICEPLSCYIIRNDSDSNLPFKTSSEAGFKKILEYKSILIDVIKSMNIKEEKYLLKLIDQKYIIKNLEYAKEVNDSEKIKQYELEYEKNMKNDNIYDKEITKICDDLPVVSIIIPVYNGSNYLRKAIDSALCQTYKKCEIIVVNDGSNDDGETESIAKSYGNKIRYYYKENGGVSTALNFGIKVMNGSFFCWLSHDDIYYNDKLEKMIRYYCNNNLINKKVILYTNFDIINEYGKKVFQTHYERFSPNEKLEYAILRGLVSGIAMIIPKQAFDDCGYFNEKYRCVQDFLFFFDCLNQYKFIFLPDVTGATRIHSKQVTYTNKKVYEENNYLWIYMQKKLSDEKKILLNDSLFDFYEEMYKFLLYNNNYKDAQDFSKKEMNNIIEEYTTKIKNYITGINQLDLLKIVQDYYYKNIIMDNEFKLLIENVGLYNFINFIYKYKEMNNNDKKIYNTIYKQLIVKKKNKPIMQRNGLEKLTYSIKLNGVKETINKIIKHI